MLKIIFLMLISNFATSPNSSCSQAKQAATTSFEFDSLIFRHSTISGRIPSNRKSNELILNSDKSILLYTEESAVKGDREESFVKGEADMKTFNELVSLLATFDFEAVKSYKYDAGGARARYSFAFLKNGAIEETLISYKTYQIPATQEMARLEKLMFQLIKNMKIVSEEERPANKIKYCSIYYYTFTEDFIEKKLIINQSAVQLLLRHYLLYAKEVGAEDVEEIFFSHKMNNGSGKYICQADINGKWQVVKRGETDGRYFRFTAESGETVILDIGVNFFTHTVKHEYEKWILEQN